MSGMAEQYRAANRANWDERAGLHVVSRFYDVQGWLAERRPPRRHEAEALGDVSGLRLLHLQCHFGLDTLAWAGAGATVTGLDFSAPAIEAAREIAERAGLSERATFVCADVYDATEALGGQTFDIVYVSLGSLCWLPSIEAWGAQVGGLVAAGGRFYLHDVHPLAQALAEDRPLVTLSYFEEAEPRADVSGTTYADAPRLLDNRASYEWNHGIRETVNALTGHGLRLERLAEHDWTVWPQFSWLVQNEEGGWQSPPGAPRLPLSFSLLATKG